MKILIRAILVLIVSISNHSYAVASQTTNEIIEKTQKSEAPLYSESGSSEDLAQEFLNEVGRRRGEIVVEVFSPYKLDKNEEDDLKKIILNK